MSPLLRSISLEPPKGGINAYPKLVPTKQMGDIFTMLKKQIFKKIIRLRVSAAEKDSTIVFLDFQVLIHHIYFLCLVRAVGLGYLATDNKELKRAGTAKTKTISFARTMNP